MLEELSTGTRPLFSYLVMGEVPHDHLNFEGKACKSRKEVSWHVEQA